MYASLDFTQCNNIMRVSVLIFPVCCKPLWALGAVE